MLEVNFVRLPWLLDLVICTGALFLLKYVRLLALLLVIPFNTNPNLSLNLELACTKYKFELSIKY